MRSVYCKVGSILERTTLLLSVFWNHNSSKIVTFKILLTSFTFVPFRIFFLIWVYWHLNLTTWERKIKTTVKYPNETNKATFSINCWHVHICYMKQSNHFQKPCLGVFFVTFLHSFFYHLCLCLSAAILKEKFGFLDIKNLIIKIFTVIYNVLQHYYDEWRSPESWSLLLMSPLADREACALTQSIEKYIKRSFYKTWKNRSFSCFRKQANSCFSGHMPFFEFVL